MRSAVCLTFSILCASLVEPQRVDGTPSSPSPNTCENASRQLFGEPPTPLAGEVKEPKKVHHVNVKFPSLPPGTVGGGVWVGEALIAPDGRVRRVWALRDLNSSPRFHS